MSYNFALPMTVAEFLDATRQLNADEQEWLVRSLQEDEFAVWEKQQEDDPGYDAWFRAGVEEALADTSPYIPHEQDIRETAEIIVAARERQELKASA